MGRTRVTKRITINVPSGTLEILQCGVCEVQLSRSPVYIQHDGAALCGGCFTPESTAIRNIYYEALAKFITFPCKYKELGCVETVPFVKNDEAIPHEEVCKHRQWVCPVLGSAHCDWLGPRAELLQHCQDQHPNHVLQNRCTLEHDIITSNEKTYLLHWFHELFLLHVKVSLATRKLYHSVRYLGRSDKANDFSYNVDIKRNKAQLLREGEVSPQGCLAIQEDTSLTLDINSLLSVLGGFDGAMFTVEVQRRGRVMPPEVCAGCETLVTPLVYRDSRGWLCKSCTPARRICKNQDQGCNHEDIGKKCVKHMWYFCEQCTVCEICDTVFEQGSLFAHYASACLPVCKLGSTLRLKQIKGETHYCLVSGAAGIAVCLYEFGLDNTGFELDVYIPVVSERLREFRCEVCVIQPATGLVRTYTPDIIYKEDFDWRIKVEKTDFSSWDEPFDVCVDITNI